MKSLGRTFQNYYQKAARMHFPPPNNSAIKDLQLGLCLVSARVFFPRETSQRTNNKVNLICLCMCMCLCVFACTRARPSLYMGKNLA